MAPNAAAQPPAAAAQPTVFTVVLPVEVTGVVDIGRLQRELQALDETMQAQALRGAEQKLPKTSYLLDKMAQQNHLDFNASADRQKLLAAIKDVRTKAPQLHVSFGADPSPAFLEKLVAWMRREIHPHVLVSVGLQPNIGVGCTLRSSNKYFDMSLREEMLAKRSILLAKLEEMTAIPAMPVASVAKAPTPATTVHQTVNKVPVASGVPT